MEGNGRKYLKEKRVVELEIELLSGLHIGGMKDDIRIGGIDSPVIRDAYGRIFIPGSSIKGKLRSILEKKRSDYSEIFEFESVEVMGVFREYGKKIRDANDRNEKDKLKREREDKIKEMRNKKSEELEGWTYRTGSGWIHECNNADCEICRVFGRAGDRKERGRAIFYDAYPEQYYSVKGSLKESADVKTEIKPENSIDRVTSAANPRQIERVGAGTKFRMKLVYDIYDEKDEELFNKLVNEWMKELENDYIGGSGTRGYGRVKIRVVGE